MSLKEKYIALFRRVLPSPFVIAILLTLVTLLLALALGNKSASNLLFDWQNGLWSSPFLAFAFQMMLMLVLGHVLALSSFFNTLIFTLIKPLKTNAQAAFIVTFATIIVALLNWGLGLIFGAVLARKIGEKFSKEGRAINYPMVAAGGYVGLMVWHGGLSGSALSKVAEKGHLQSLAKDPNLPDAITYTETVLAPMNLVCCISLLIIIPLAFYLLGRKKKGRAIQLQSEEKKEMDQVEALGMEKLEVSELFSKLMGGGILILAMYIAICFEGRALGFITPNYINFALLGFGLLLHTNIRAFLHAVDGAIRGAAGILIQFPLYFGILALMQSGGLIDLISDGFIAISNATTLPLFTFLSAGIVNVFVPSGGGQWAIQGPIIISSAQELGVPLNKVILSLAYGDQLTNMLQPFWALPLLSITGLKAKDILPYTLLLFALGLLIFGTILLVF